jgi:regulator of extracellular matrix RemA (YlzA/DUF370 family)
MMISVGNKGFIESKYVVEILKAEKIRAKALRYTAASNGRLINAAGGKIVRSIVKLKSKHVVLSSLGVKTLKSRLKKVTLTAASGKTDNSRNRRNKNCSRSGPPEFDDRRKVPDRRHFHYTHYIPERRSGTERRK